MSISKDMTRCCITLVCLALPGAVLAQPPATATATAGNTANTPPPVTINSCGPIFNKTSSPTVAGIPIPASTSSGIAIEFVNESAQPVTLVNFHVQSGGDQFVIRDVGMFSPGVSIKHQYRNGAGQAFVLPEFIAPKVTCRVGSVKFADGTVWRKGMITSSAQAAPAAAPGQPSALVANPSRLNIDSRTNSELVMVSSSARVTAFKETDDCANVATIFVVATGDASATYSVKPLAAGACTAHIVDEAGDSVAVPVVVQR